MEGGRNLKETESGGSEDVSASPVSGMGFAIFSELENDNMSSRHRSSDESRERSRREHSRYESDDDAEYRRKRIRYEGQGTPGSCRSSDWDGGRWEWEDTPRRESHNNSSRRRQPSHSPMFIGASPDARLVSPWTPCSPWDTTAPSPVSIRASGYDREEGSTAFEADDSYYNEASFQKKEAQLAKRLVRKDGSLMSLSQSKKLSQMSVDNAQWEDRQLLRSGAVRNKEAVQTEFKEDEDHRVILLVHDTKPPFLDGRVVFTKQAEPVMPVKDPTSDMAIISRKGSNLVKEVREKQSMSKSRQRFLGACWLQTW